MGILGSPPSRGAQDRGQQAGDLTPLVFAPWDEKIRDAHGVKSGDHGSFEAYLMDVAAQLEHFAAEAGVPVPELPRVVERPESSPPKLIDEYNWITITIGPESSALAARLQLRQRPRQRRA